MGIFNSSSSSNSNSSVETNSNDLNLLARVIYGEARGEPYTGQVAIGAVAVYRLAIDPLPIILMDAELMTRSGDFMTEPYSKEFVDKYIGLENIELYKQTEIYQDYKEWLMSQEKQNEAVYNIIHWQIIDRNKINDILAQIHLLSLQCLSAV